MRVVVTGLSGNLGTALLRRLTSDDGASPDPDGGPLELVGVCRRPPAGPDRRPPAPYDRAEWVALDVGARGAARSLRTVVEGADAVVHLAWLFQPSHDTGYLERVGVGGTAAVLQACRDAGVPHLVHVSSLGAYAAGPDAPGGARVDESWPHDGIASHAYSRHKAWAERLLDAHPDGTPPLVTRLRPALVLQRRAAAALLRYGLPGWVPATAVRLLPVLPLDRRLTVQTVHADDVAEAVVAVLRLRPGGAFNLAAEPPVTRDDLAAALGALPLHLPRAVLRAVVALTWQLRLQPLDPGWIDLAFETPLMDTGRARRELGWTPARGALDALAELAGGLQEAAADDASPVLRHRSLAEVAGDTVREGSVGRRRLT